MARHDTDTIDYAPVAPHRPTVTMVAVGAGGFGCVAVIALVAPAGIALSAAVAGAIADSAALIAVLVRVGLVMGFSAATLAGFALARWLWLRASLAAVVRGPLGSPLTIDTVARDGGALCSRHVDAHYAAMAPRPTAPALPAPEEGSAATMPVAPPIDTTRPVLSQLVAAGYSTPQALLVGFDAASAPAVLDLSLTGCVAVAGQSRSGKTSTAVSLIAQAVQHNAHVFVCDPHGLHPQGLLAKLAPLSGRLAKQAVTPEEIAATVALVAKIARRRLDGLDAADAPVVLVIDEFTGLVARGVLPDDTLASLLSVAVEAAKARVHCVLLAQDWTARLLGPQGAPLRRAITHRLLHRCDPSGASFLLGGVIDSRSVATLQRGEAIFWPADDSPKPIRVPLVGDEDTRYAAHGATPRPYSPTTALPKPQAAPAATMPAVPPQAPSQAPTVAQRCKELLADGVQRDSAAVAVALDLPPAVVQPALTRLAQAGELQREGSPRAYRYSRR
jgi:hypothetical protein